MSVDPYQGKRFAITASDSPSIDAFGRWRVSNPTTLFDSSFRYGLETDRWQALSVGSASSVALGASADHALLTLDTQVGTRRAFMQTYQYFKYQPGKSQLLFFTGVFGTSTESLFRRIGYYDDNEGLFFEQDGTGLNVVVRTNGVDTRTAQASWNLDTVDGNSYSGIRIDASKAQIYFIDLEWLGVGRVRWGVVHDGVPHYVHQSLHSNSVTAPYMRSAMLPARYEIKNNDAIQSYTAYGTFEITGTAVAEDTFTIGTVVHTFTDGIVKAYGIMDFRGTLSNLGSFTIGTRTYNIIATVASTDDIKVGSNFNHTMVNVVKAINATGTPDVTYYGTIVRNAQVYANFVGNMGSYSSTIIEALNAGLDGNSIAVNMYAVGGTFYNGTLLSGGAGSSGAVFCGTSGNHLAYVMTRALNATGTPDIDYVGTLTANAQVSGTWGQESGTISRVYLRAKTPTYGGVVGNGIAVAESTANLTYSDGAGTSLTGGVDSSFTMKAICSSVISEGGMEINRAPVWSVSNGTNAIAVATVETPVLYIRPRTIFGAGSIANRAYAVPTDLSLYVTSQAINYKVYWRETHVDGTWAKVSTKSMMEHTPVNGTRTAGNVIMTGYVAASANERSDLLAVLKENIPLTLDYAGTTQYGLTITAVAMTGTANVSASITWREIY